MVESTQYKTDFSIVFLGHVNAGKSTLFNAFMVGNGNISEQQLQKQRQTAQQINMFSRWESHSSDILEEEKRTGKTIEFNKKQVQFRGKNLTLFDAPGHNNFIPSMTSTVMLSEVAILVISADQGQFDAGFAFQQENKIENNFQKQQETDKSSQEGSSRQHLKIIASSNIQKLIIVINKMDCQTVQWEQTIFNERVNYIKDVLRRQGNDAGMLEKIEFIPISAKDESENVFHQKNKHRYEWYTGKTLFDTIESIQIPKLQQDSQVVFIGVQQKHEAKNGISGYLQKGIVKKGDQLKCLPFNVFMKVQKIQTDKNDEEPDDFIDSCFQDQWVTLYFDRETYLLDAEKIIFTNQSEQFTSRRKILVQLSTFKFPQHTQIIQFQELILHNRGMNINCIISNIYSLDHGKYTKEKLMREFRNYTCILTFNEDVVFQKYSENSLLGTILIRNNNSALAKGIVLKFSKQ